MLDKALLAIQNKIID